VTHRVSGLCQRVALRLGPLWPYHTWYLQVYPLFIIDPHFADPEKVGVLRYRFLLQSLR
jgi:hypothetical protein